MAHKRKIAYLLHQFPRSTDTFIRRELQALNGLKTGVEVVSIWRPDSQTVSGDLINAWQGITTYLLPSSSLLLLIVVLRRLLFGPLRFLSTLKLALVSSPPGLRQHIYQIIYFVEALLAADICLKKSYKHIHNHNGDNSGTVAMLCSNYCKIPVSITIHGPHIFFEPTKNKIFTKVKRSKFIRCIGYFCKSQVLLFSSQDYESKCKIIRCGIDVTNISYRKPQSVVEVVFCAARLDAEKGITYLLEALSILRGQGYEIRLRIAGDGPSRASLENSASRLGLDDLVTFLGTLEMDEIFAELGNADIFALSSFAEGIPVSLMEAMATGVPVVATNVGGTAELVENEKSGLLVEPANAKKLAHQLERLITDPSLRAKISSAARQKIEAEYNIKSEVKKLKKELEKKEFC